MFHTLRGPNRARIAIAGLALLAAFALSGCLKAEVRLDAAGGGTMTMEVSKLSREGYEDLRTKLSSPSVKVVDAAYADGVGRYEVKFTDVRKLRTAPLFSVIRVDHTGLDQPRRTLEISIPRRVRQEKEPDLPPDDYVAADLRVVFPGAVLETTGTRAGDTTSSWQIRIVDLLGTGRIDNKTVYEVAAAQ